jgi:hypothetical protein
MPNATTFPFWYLNSYLAIMYFVSICAFLFIDNCCDSDIVGDCLVCLDIGIGMGIDAP